MFKTEDMGYLEASSKFLAVRLLINSIQTI